MRMEAEDNLCECKLDILGVCKTKLKDSETFGWNGVKDKGNIRSG